VESRVGQSTGLNQAQAGRLLMLLAPIALLPVPIIGGSSTGQSGSQSGSGQQSGGGGLGGLLGGLLGGGN